MTAKRDSRGSGGLVNSILRQLQGWPDWLVLLPLGLLVLAVLFLAAYSTSVALQARDLEVKNTRVDVPAQRSSLDLIIAAALELEGLHQYTVTGDTADLMESRDNAVARRQAVDQLELLIPGLAAEARRYSEDVLESAYRLEASLPDPTTVVQLDPAAREARFTESRDDLRDMLMYASSLHAEIRTAIDSASTRIVAAERRAWHFTLGLAALALLASLLVIWLVRRVRWLAEVSRRRRIQVETAMENRARLIRGITHDLKNPLAAADGNAQLLELAVVGELTEEQQTTVQRIRRGIDGALGIVSDLLELNRAESGRLQIDVSPTDVASILVDTAEEYEYRADAARVTLEIDVPPELPQTVTDGARVRQIISNLLSNAVKHTPEGGRIRVSADVRANADVPLRRDSLALSVADTGPGIPREEQERIFEEFYRASTPGRGPLGVGLGLSISRRIARLLDGEITVESEPGDGSVFTLWLPVEEDSARNLRAA